MGRAGAFNKIYRRHYCYSEIFFAEELTAISKITWTRLRPDFGSALAFGLLYLHHINAIISHRLKMT